MNKKLTLFLLLLGYLLSARGQQLTQFNYFVYKPVLFNPAAAGLNTENEIWINLRQQWLGFKDAPQSLYLYAQFNANRKPPVSFKKYSLRISDPSYYARLQPEPSHPVSLYAGGFIYYDKHGFLSNTTAMLSFTGRMKLGEDKENNLSLGVQFGINNFNYDLNSLHVLVPEPDFTYQRFIQYNESTLYLDMNAGLWFETPDYYVGISTLRLLGNSFPVGGQSAVYELSPHYYLLAGYRIFKDMDDWKIYPGIIAGYSSTGLIKSIYLKTVYDEKYFGILTGNENYAGLVLGMHYKKMILGYGFESNLTGIAGYQYGSHELIWGMIF